MKLHEIADRLVEERGRLGYSRVAFARLLDMSVEGLRLIEAGQSEFKVTVLADAAAAGVDIQYVLTGLHSENAAAVAKQVGFDRQAVHGNVSGVAFAQTGSNVQIQTNHVTTEKHITRTVAVTKPGEDHITPQQRRALMDLVEEIVVTEAKLKRDPKTHRAVWGSLNKHCGVNTYTLIALNDFEKARKYLNMWLGRLNSAPSASVKNDDAKRKRTYAYIKTNTKTAEGRAAFDDYLLRKFGKITSLTELDSEQLETARRYVAGVVSRRNRV